MTLPGPSGQERVAQQRRMTLPGLGVCGLGRRRGLGRLGEASKDSLLEGLGVDGFLGGLGSLRGVRQHRAGHEAPCAGHHEPDQAHVPAQGDGSNACTPGGDPKPEQQRRTARASCSIQKFLSHPSMIGNFSQNLTHHAARNWRIEWHNRAVPMRQECKNYESRTYANGETVRKCNLDLAPDAPWRCPAQCAGYGPRLADVNWAHGSLISPPAPPEPPGIDDGSAAALLNEAEEIINSVGPQVLAEVRADQEKAAKRSRWFRFPRRRR
jgi:hypothetical protein